MKSKKNNKHKWSFIKQMLILAVLAAPFLYVICVVFLEPVVPRTRTLFGNYESFCKTTKSWFFYDELPSSAQKVKYYYHVAFWQRDIGYISTMNDEDYEYALTTHKDDFINEFTSIHPFEKFILSQYVHNEDKKIVSLDTDFNGRLIYLQRFCNSEEINNYYYLAYFEHDSSDYYQLYGIIVNDTTKEVIEFHYQEPYEELFK